MNKKNILVGQSGGPTAVINGSLYGVICEGARHSDAVGCVYGMINGIEGFLADSYMNLSETLSDDDLELLRLTPAAYLGSCRFKLPENLSDSFYRVLCHVAAHAAVDLLHSARVAPAGDIGRKRISLDVHKHCADDYDAHKFFDSFPDFTLISPII